MRRVILLLFASLLAFPSGWAQTHTFKGYEIKLVSVERTGKSEWKWGGTLPFKASKGGEIVVFPFSFRLVDPLQGKEAQFTRFAVKDADGKSCGEVALIRDFTVSATQEFELPFELPRTARPKTVALNDLVFDLDKIAKTESPKDEKKD